MPPGRPASGYNEQHFKNPRRILQGYVTRNAGKAVFPDLEAAVRHFVQKHYKPEHVPSHAKQPWDKLKARIVRRFPDVFRGPRKEVEEIEDLVRLVAQKDHLGARRKFRERASKENRVIVRYDQGRCRPHAARGTATPLRQSRNLSVEVPQSPSERMEVPIVDPEPSSVPSVVQSQREGRNPLATKVIQRDPSSASSRLPNLDVTPPIASLPRPPPGPPAALNPTRPRIVSSAMNLSAPGPSFPRVAPSAVNPAFSTSFSAPLEPAIGLAGYPDLIALSQLCRGRLDFHIYKLIGFGLHTRAILEQWALFPDLNTELQLLFSSQDMEECPSFAELVILRRAIITGFYPKA
ncbi:hypothetical protein CPB83DRAFT_900438 [Crepidotus variabilis]|uniref:Uncharacterized protein n=1 Tax=Crepidotus variabilis TaxID=179855 RepID=A0A9P6E350_9AGAR|nr:hypothetical protein CPB83DRAFT_900438 [Crepidotus variabilis]